jgi:uncharacterized membrane protein YeiH
VHLAAATYNLSAVLGSHLTTSLFVSGVFVFGLSGGLAGARKNFDVFGVTVLAGIVGLAGGALRDTFLGIPAMAVFDWRMVLAVVAAGCVAFVAHGPLLRLHYPIQILDAIGLALFSVVGTDISLLNHATPLAAILLGMATGIGGGVVRDLVLNEVPQVLHSGLYAIPSLMGASLIAIGNELKLLSLWWCVMAGVVCLGVRLVGIIYDVNLPRAR